jgi:hypothetical protein
MADEQQPDLTHEEVERASTLLDIRRIIGGVLGLYGLLLLGAGLFGSEADKDKAAGVNINLWVALALIVAAALFFLWAGTRPLVDELEDEEVREAEPSAPARP